MYIKFIKLILVVFYLLALNKVAAAEFKHGVSTFGDLKYNKDFKHFDYVNPDAPKGGMIKYGTEGTFNSLNPFILKGISASGISMIFDSLMDSSDDEISTRYGLIAKSAKLADDRSSIIFKLNQKARFHDGSKITADDVIFSFNTLVKEGHPSYAMIYTDVKEVEKIDDYNVKFIFKNNKNRNLPVALAGLSIFSKKYYQNNQFNKTTMNPPLGSGPYKIKSIKAGHSVTYERVKDYWAKDLAVNKGKYNFDIVAYDYYRDNNILVEAFKSGAYDFRQENVARNWANAYNITKVSNGEIIKKKIPHSLPTGMQAFVFNLRKDKFKNKELRKAISYAFDFEWVRSKIFYGSYSRTKSYFSNSQFASTALPKGEELNILKNLKNRFPNQIPDQVFNSSFIPPITDGSGYFRSNLLKAKQILQKAGYLVKEGKLIDPDTNKQLEIEFLIVSKAFQMIIAPMKKNLAKLGIKAKIRLVDENQYQIRLNNYDYDIMVTVFGQNLIPGNEQFAYWHSSQIAIEGGRNLTGVKNKAVDYLVERITKVNSKAELKALTKALDRILLWNFYTIPQWHSRNYRILYKNKFMMPEVIPSFSMGLNSWWLDYR